MIPLQSLSPSPPPPLSSSSSSLPFLASHTQRQREGGMWGWGWGVAEVGGRHKGPGAVGFALGRVKTRGWIGVTGGQRGGSGGVQGWGLGRNLRVRKPERELRWEGARGWGGLWEGRIHGWESTTQDSLWLRYGFFVLTLKWDLQWIGSRKGFSLGNAIHYISNPV